MASARQLVSVISRQRLSVQAINTCQRSLHTTTIRLNSSLSETQKKNFTEVLTDKFIGQVQGQGIKQRKLEPTRFVRIDALPTTVTSEDIYKLAREAFPQGDKSIVEAIFCRTYDFKFYGRCVMLMKSVEDARRVVEYGNRRSVGGSTIKVSFTGTEDSDPNTLMSALRRPELTSITDSTSASGRSVTIVGLPWGTRPDHVLGYLRHRNFFPVEGAPDNVLLLRTKEHSSVAKYLVKFDSESEAWRCVRTFHNSIFVSKEREENFKLSVSVVY